MKQKARGVFQIAYRTALSMFSAAKKPVSAEAVSEIAVYYLREQNYPNVVWNENKLSWL